MIENLASWSRFTDRQAQAPPLLFVNGFRHRPGKNVRCPMHSHEGIEIVYHPTGTGTTRLEEGRSVNFAPGSVVVYAPDERHDQILATEGEDFCLQLAVPRRRRDVPRKCFHLTSLTNAVVLEDIRLLSRDHVRMSSPEQALFNLRATSALCALIHVARTRSDEDEGTPGRKYVAQAEHYIREHFGRLKTLREVAEHIGISYDHLRHSFRALRHGSVVSYLNQVRMERAQALLSHSRIPLKQVASQCGFADEYYFSAVFRKFTGMPPGRYRRQAGP